jgi:hypothetical protein
MTIYAAIVSTGLFIVLGIIYWELLLLANKVQELVELQHIAAIQNAENQRAVKWLCDTILMDIKKRNPPPQT